MNPYAEFTAQKAPGAEGNPYAQYMRAPVADEQEQSVISTVNNPSKPTPSYFGLTEVPSQVSAGFEQFFKGQVPIAAGQTAVQAGELLQKKADQFAGKSIDEAAKISLTNSLVKYASDGNPGLLEAFKVLYTLETDLLFSFMDKETKVPAQMVRAGERLVASKQKEMQSLGLARSDSQLGGFAFDVGSGIGSVTTSIGATIVTRDPKVGAAFFGWLQNSQSYQEARAAGKTPQEATKAAMEVAGAVTILEFIGGRYFLQVAANNSFMRKTLLRATGQAAEETTQGAAEEAILREEGVRDKSLNEAVLNVAYQGLVGFISGAPVAAVVSKMEGVGKKQGLSEEKTKEIIDNFVKNKDQVVDAAAALIDKDSANVAVDAQGHKQVLEAIGKNEAAKEKDSVTVTTEPDYLSQAKEIKAQITAEKTGKVYDVKTPSTLRSAIGYIPESISSFIKRTGGITDEAGELKQRGVNPKRLPGLIRKVGEKSILGMDAIRQRLYDAGYFQDKTDYNEITNTEIWDAIAGDLDGKRRYNAFDQQRIDEYIDQNPLVTDRYAAMGITDEMTDAEVARILRENDAAETKSTEVSPDPNDPRFNGELDAALLSAKVPKSKQEVFAQVLEAERNKGSALKEKAGDALKDLGSMVDAVLTPISTRLKAISPKLRARLRKFEFDRNQRINADQEAVKPFLEKYSKMPATDRVILDFAMRNGDAETIRQITVAHDMTKELEAVRTALDDLYKRAKSVGMDIGYRKNFFPRYVTKPEAMLNFFSKTEAWTSISEAIRRKEMELGRPLETSEKAYLINTLLRGYSVEQITLARPSALKERMIDTVTPEINNFYGTSDQAIMRYITSVNDAVETRKFFGKGATEFEKIEDSIAYFVLREMENGNIKPADEVELTRIMKARFQRGQMGAFWRIYKNVGYIDTMGSPISAITQLGDLSLAFYKSGIYRTLTALTRAAVGKSEVTREDIGVTQIAQEFEGDNTSAKAVRGIFKAVGLEKMDAIGKEVTINAALQRFRALAKKPTNEFRESLEVIFGEETQSVIDDLQNKRNSENVKLLLFNELLDLQPVALSEMPEKYLRMGNGRVLYMLKTYTVKQFDIYRNEIFEQIKTNPVQGIKNLVRLMTFYVMMNAGADFLKDLLLNRETEPDEAVVNNIARIFGLSKYHVYSARREGAGTAAFKTIAPPFKLIDSTTKDMAKLIENGEVDMDELETVASVPIAGKFWYWWFGAGADK